jgi:SET domain-containing protein
MVKAAGWGLYAAEPIKKKDFVEFYTGEIL